MAERVLLVEDSRTQAEALRSDLADAGYDVTVAPEGEQALQRLREDEPFDCVLSDILMPGMSGFDLTRTIKREFGPAAPAIILLTSLTDASDIVRGLEAGADNYLTKPYEPAFLIQRIEQVLEARRERGAAREPDAGPPVEIRFMGQIFTIDAGREQILDMLLSSFEELIRASEELRKSKDQLQRLHTQAEERADRLARLQQVTEKLSRSRTPAEVVHVVVTTAREALGADAGLASIVDADRDELVLLDAVGFGPEDRPQDRIPLSSDHPIARAARDGDLVGVTDHGQAGFTGGTSVAAPLKENGQVIGSWAIEFNKVRSIGESDRQFFLTLTRLFSQALERSRLFEGERKARADAEEANRAKSQFLASMSHDLRTPLNAIGGYVDLISLGIRGPVTDAQLTDLDRIKRSQEFLLSLINDVLNFAKSEAGTVVFKVGPVPVGPLLSDLDDMLRPQMQAKSIDYSWSAENKKTCLLGDEEKLQQVLLNLGGNALKFTPEGGTISIDCVEKDDVAVITVSDTGIGIPEEDLASIFDPFVQVHPNLTDSRDGIGLGLAISHQLITGMGGTLTVESEVGVGSTFEITLPTVPSPAQKQDA